MSKARKNEEEKRFGVLTFVKILFFIIIIPVLIISIIIIYKANKYPDKIPDIFGYKPMIVLTGSMEGTINTGDLVFVKVVDTNTLKKGDIIAFRNEKNTVTTHRIVEVMEANGSKLFTTKGDANNAEDANIVKSSEVEGIYVSRIGKLGNFLMFVQQPIGLVVILLVILVVGLICLQIVNKLEDKKLSKEEEKERKEFLEYKKMKEEQEKQNKNS